MSEDSKIYIAAKPVLGGLGYHLYLVYDEDGDPSTIDDQSVIRGGPQNEGLDHDPGNIALQIDDPIAASLDNYGLGQTYVDRDFTPLTLPFGQTADSLWADLVSEANSMTNG